MPILQLARLPVLLDLLGPPALLIHATPNNPLGWNTTTSIPQGRGETNYLIRKARVTLTLASGGQYAYTGAIRDYRTYFLTNDPRYIPPASSKAPVELFGTGFRGDFTAANFVQDSPFAVNPDGGNFTNRTAYAAAFSTNGILIDASNNVGDDGTNGIASPFEMSPFATGRSPTVTEGELMPVGGQIHFDINLEDPFVYRYLQTAWLDKRSTNLVYPAPIFGPVDRHQRSSQAAFLSGYGPLMVYAGERFHADRTACRYRNYCNLVHSAPSSSFKGKDKRAHG